MDIATIIKDLGVPIGMLVWFMFRAEKRLANLERAVTSLAAILRADVTGVAQEPKT